MQAEMAEAQEKLKDEVVEASAGGGMVKVKMSGDLRLLEITIDPEAIDPEDAELLQDMVLAAVNEALRSAQELAATQDGRHRRLGGGGLAACRAVARPRLDASTVYAGPISGWSPSSRKLPGIGQRTAQRLAFHILRADDDDALGARRRDPRGEGEGRALRGLLQPRRGAALPDLRGRRAATASLICVVEEPADVIPIERTGEYRGLYHVLGGALSPIDGIDPEDLKIAELVDARRRRRGRARSSWRPTRRPPARRPPSTSPTLLRGRGRRSPASPAACRSAPTSSTPTRSRSARLWRAASPWGRSRRTSEIRSDQLNRPGRGLLMRRNKGMLVLALLALLTMTISVTVGTDRERLRRQGRRGEEEVQEEESRSIRQEEEVQEEEGGPGLTCSSHADLVGWR